MFDVNERRIYYNTINSGINGFLILQSPKKNLENSPGTSMTELKAGIPMSPNGNQRNDPHDNHHAPLSNSKVLGFIPLQIQGDFGCLCKPLKCVKFWINPTVALAAVVIIWYSNIY